MNIDHKIAAVVVLYNPTNQILENINSYIDQVDRIFVIDNSDTPSELINIKFKGVDKLFYISKSSNIGIAAALNLGAQKALSEGFDYLLTMDQDSTAPANLIVNLLECFLLNNRTVLAAPVLYHPQGKSLHKIIEKSCEEVFTAWTSGSLIDLRIFSETGGFKEEFFIDYVDHEFCLRLNKMGYKVFVCNKAKLIHNLGNIKPVNLFFRKVYPTNHSALRLYYRTRNRFYVKNIFGKDFPDFFKQDNKDFWRTFVKVILFEKDKISKVMYSIRGYRDFRKNVFGKYHN